MMRAPSLLCSVLLMAACGDDGGAAPIDARAIDAGTDATACPRDPCDIFEQCGCEHLPEKPVCDVRATNAFITGCRAGNPQGTHTTTCGQATSCAAVHTCVAGRCYQYCDDHADCTTGPGGLCTIEPRFQNMPFGMRVCSTGCDATSVTNPSCPSGWACHLWLGGAAANAPWYTDCDAPPVAGGNVGDQCVNGFGCRPGLSCIQPPGMGSICRPLCKCPGGDCAGGTCPAGSTCMPFEPPAVFGDVTYGACN